MLAFMPSRRVRRLSGYVLFVCGWAGVAGTQSGIVSARDTSETVQCCATTSTC
jgi:hypothetical protein